MSFQIIRGTEYVCESGVEWMGGGTKRQCGRALPPPPRRGSAARRASASLTIPCCTDTPAACGQPRATLSVYASVGCHWLALLRDLHSNRVVMAVTFCPTGAPVARLRGATGHRGPGPGHRAHPQQRVGGVGLGVGFGRTVASEIEAPDMLADLI